ncbi:hypothetical protein RRG08_021765 [Elysia crispata]|uniref:Uncharacterized protein n=1 Tax=Elysia crispata TaxID=231223 RepID=A0AAE0ZXU0_9GAST|nr:hypothetical protein RRG08_021765 [Elysia crispata]
MLCVCVSREQKGGVALFSALVANLPAHGCQPPIHCNLQSKVQSGSLSVKWTQRHRATVPGKQCRELDKTLVSTKPWFLFAVQLALQWAKQQLDSRSWQVVAIKMHRSQDCIHAHSSERRRKILSTQIYWLCLEVLSEQRYLRSRPENWVLLYGNG